MALRKNVANLKTCPRCGAPTHLACARFCGHCGASPLRQQSRVADVAAAGAGALRAYRDEPDRAELSRVRRTDALRLSESVPVLRRETRDGSEVAALKPLPRLCDWAARGSHGTCGRGLSPRDY